MGYEPMTSEKIATCIIYNYIPAMSNSYETFPETYKEEIVGSGGVVEIVEKQAWGEGDKFFYDIVYEDGKVIRIFNPHIVHFKRKETK